MVAATSRISHLLGLFHSRRDSLAVPALEKLLNILVDEETPLAGCKRIAYGLPEETWESGEGALSLLILLDSSDARRVELAMSRAPEAVLESEQGRTLLLSAAQNEEFPLELRASLLGRFLSGEHTPAQFEDESLVSLSCSLLFFGELFQASVFRFVSQLAAGETLLAARAQRRLLELFRDPKTLEADRRRLESALSFAVRFQEVMSWEAEHPLSEVRARLVSGVLSHVENYYRRDSDRPRPAGCTEYLLQIAGSQTILLRDRDSAIGYLCHGAGNAVCQEKSPVLKAAVALVSAVGKEHEANFDSSLVLLRDAAEAGVESAQRALAGLWEKRPELSPELRARRRWERLLRTARAEEGPKDDIGARRAAMISLGTFVLGVPEVMQGLLDIARDSDVPAVLRDRAMATVANGDVNARRERGKVEPEVLTLCIELVESGELAESFTPHPLAEGVDEVNWSGVFKLLGQAAEAGDAKALRVLEGLSENPEASSQLRYAAFSVIPEEVRANKDWTKSSWLELLKNAEGLEHWYAMGVPKKLPVATWESVEARTALFALLGRVGEGQFRSLDALLERLPNSIWDSQAGKHCLLVIASSEQSEKAIHDVPVINVKTKVLALLRLFAADSQVISAVAEIANNRPLASETVRGKALETLGYAAIESSAAYQSLRRILEVAIGPDGGSSPQHWIRLQAIHVLAEERLNDLETWSAFGSVLAREDCCDTTRKVIVRHLGGSKMSDQKLTEVCSIVPGEEPALS